MTPERKIDEEDERRCGVERRCGNPCRPEGDQCRECAAYWERMKADGLWVSGKGWTDKAMKKWSGR